MTDKTTAVPRPQESWLRTVSVPATSLIVGLSGVIATLLYNSGQLQVTRTKEIAGLVEQLTSPDANKRIMASAVLGLYGEPAIPALTAMLGNDESGVAKAAAESLVQIGRPAEQVLVYRYCKRPRRMTLPNDRGWALYALARLGSHKCTDLIANTLDDETEAAWVRGEAIEAACMLGETQFVPAIRRIASRGAAVDTTLAQWAAWCLGEMGAKDTSKDLVAFLEHADRLVRYYAYKSLFQLKDASVSAKVCAAADAEQLKTDSEQWLKDEARAACSATTARDQG